MTTINNNLNVGSGLIKRVASNDTAAAAGAATGRAAAYGTDNLVRTGAPASAGGSANATATAALDRLATAYDPDPATFARNLAEASLNDVARQIG